MCEIHYISFLGMKTTNISAENSQWFYIWMIDFIIIYSNKGTTFSLLKYHCTMYYQSDFMPFFESLKSAMLRVALFVVWIYCYHTTVAAIESGWDRIFSSNSKLLWQFDTYQHWLVWYDFLKISFLIMVDLFHCRLNIRNIPWKITVKLRRKWSSEVWGQMLKVKIWKKG